MVILMGHDFPERDSISLRNWFWVRIQFVIIRQIEYWFLVCWCSNSRTVNNRADSFKSGIGCPSCHLRSEQQKFSFHLQLFPRIPTIPKSQIGDSTIPRYKKKIANRCYGFSLTPGVKFTTGRSLNLNWWSLCSIWYSLHEWSICSINLCSRIAIDNLATPSWINVVKGSPSQFPVLSSSHNLCILSTWRKLLVIEWDEMNQWLLYTLNQISALKADHSSL